MLNKPITKQSQTLSKRKKREAKKIKKRKMHFRVEVPFQIESTAKFDMNNKNTYFKGFHEFTLINFSCSFRTTFHQHCVWRFIFKKYILLRTNDCMVQNYRRLLRITYRKNRESHEVGLNISFLKGIIFRGYTILRI